MSSDTSEANNYKLEGNKHFSKGEQQKAIECFSKAINIDDSQHVFYSNRSACHSELKQYDEALKDANRCIELKPDQAKGYSRKVVALFGQEDYKQAQDVCNQGLKIDPNNQNLTKTLEQIQTKLSNPFAGLQGKIAANPQTAAYLNDPEFVRDVNALITDPKNNFQKVMSNPKLMPVLQMMLSEQGINLGAGGVPPSQANATSQPQTNTDTKSEDSTKTEANDEKNDSMKVDYESLSDEQKKEYDAEQAKESGNQFYRQRKFEEAIEEYGKAIELNPKSPVYLRNRSAVYFMMKEWDKCIEDCKKAIEVSRENYANLENVAKAFTRLGDVAMKQEKFDEAVDYYNKSLLEIKEYSVRKKLKLAEKARDNAQREAYINPELALEHKEKGNEHFRNSKQKESIDEYSESIRRNPKDHKVYSNRAGAYTKMALWKEAIDDCNKCIELEPSFAKAYLRKGKIEHFYREYQKSLATFNKGLEYEPNSTQLLEARMQTMQAIGAANASGAADPERQARAMADPEVQRILKDPTMMKVIEDIKTNPAAAQNLLKDPEISKNIQTLYAAGIIQIQ